MAADRRSLLRMGAQIAFLVTLLAGHSQGAPFIAWQNAGAGLDLGGGKGVLEVAAGGTPTVVYAVVDGAGIFRSADVGATWVPLRGDAPPLASPYTLAVSPADGNLVLASVAADGAGLWRTADGGRTWARCGAKATGMASDDVEWVTFLASNPKVVLAGHRAGRAISVSGDGGQSWKAVDIGGEMKGQMPLALGETRWVVASRAQGGIRYTEDGGAQWRAAEGPTGYFPGPLPVIQAADHLFSSQHHGFNRSADGGRTWQFVMEAHTRVVGSAGEVAFREHRQAIRGTDDRIFTLEMSDNFGQSWADVTGSLQRLVPNALRPHLVISNKVDPYAHERVATAWAGDAGGKSVFLALGKAGLYRGRLMWARRGPLVAGVQTDPLALREGDEQTPVRVQAMASARTGRVRRVYADLGVLGLPPLDLFDDAKHDDGEAGDKAYANTFTLPANTPAGEVTVGVVAEDEAGRVSSTTAALLIASPNEKLVVWDGDRFTRGLPWVSPAAPLNFIKAQTEEAHEGRVALEFHGEGGGYIGGGWNWHGWYPDNAGNDIRRYSNLSFWVKMEGDSKPDALSIGLNCSAGRKQTAMANVLDYCQGLNDGNWHEVVIPLKDIVGETTGFDPRTAWELDIQTWSPTARSFSVYLDDIAFDNRRVRPRSEWVTLPEERRPAPLGTDVVQVAASVDVRAPGTPISPYIYGAAMGDRKAALEMGLTNLRAGGNPISGFNWRKGVASKGADWYFQNEGTETPPENTWVARFHGENRKVGLETYLSIPMMGRVAKDGTSVAFDTRKYPDQESWAGKVQPGDRLAHAGNGRQYVRGDDGRLQLDANGKAILRDVAPNPDDTSVEMSPEEQCRLLEFMAGELKYGTAGQGGVRFVALDNEPTLWHSTHRGMHPRGVGYDELWERTRTYAGLLKKIDPAVQIAGPTAWGWTSYFYSGLDQQLIGEGKGTWDNPPDCAAHGGVPLVKWWLRKLNEHEKQTGQRLVDILDFHFYPQTGIFMGGTPNDPKTMEARVQETRAMWDPTWKDPSWMGKETGGVIQLIRLMKQWVAENNPGMKTAIGEYCFGGEQDVSGGVAQAELLGVFAREGLDFAHYWFFPTANSPQYFAFKMFRNPDGKHTAFGDRYLPATCSAPDDVSIHAARNTQAGTVTFVLVNKRPSRGARINLDLGAPAPAQDVVVYEYSGADRSCIGQAPARRVEGRQVAIDLPPMAVLRFDLRLAAGAAGR